MFTFSTLIGALTTLGVSSMAGSVLRHYEKSHLAETLATITYTGALGYGVYLIINLLQYTSGLFL